MGWRMDPKAKIGLRRQSVALLDEAIVKERAALVKQEERYHGQPKARFQSTLRGAPAVAE